MDLGKTVAKACGAAEPRQALARRPDSWRAGGKRSAQCGQLHRPHEGVMLTEARQGRDAAGGSVHEGNGPAEGRRRTTPSFS